MAGQTLQELIAARKGRHTYAELATMAGGTPGVSRWQQFGTGRLSASPHPDAVRGMAKALRVPISTVWDAIGVSLGLELAPDESPLIARIPVGTSRLRERQVDLTLGLLDEMLYLNDLVEKAAASADDPGNVRPLRSAARKKTGTENRGPRGRRGGRGTDTSAERPEPE